MRETLYLLRRGYARAVKLDVAPFPAMVSYESREASELE